MNQANLNIANLEKRVDIANYEKTIQTAFQEVNDQLAGQDTWASQLQAVTQEADAGERDYRYSQLRYREGIDDYLAVLVAQRSWYTAEQSQIAAHLGMLTQKITLYKVLGGGWTQTRQ